MYYTTWVLIQNKNSKNQSSELHFAFRSLDSQARYLYHFKIWYSVILEKILDWRPVYHDQFLCCIILFNATLKLLWSKKGKRLRTMETKSNIHWACLATLLKHAFSFIPNIWTTDILHTLTHIRKEKLA